MPIDARALQFLIRLLPFTFFLLPVRLLLHVLQQWNPPATTGWFVRVPSHGWVAWPSLVIGFADLVAVVAAWLVTGYLLGHRVVPPLGWIVPFVPRLYNLLKAVIPTHTPSGRSTGWLPGVLIVILASLLLSTIVSLYGSPLVFWMLNVVLLTCSLIANGSYARFCQEMWPELRMSFHSRASALRAEHEARKATIRALALEQQVSERLMEEEDQRFEHALLGFYDPNNR